LGFLLKGGVFGLSQLVFYCSILFVIIERYLYISKASKIDSLLMRDIRDNLNSGNLDLARSIAERNNSASGNIVKEGILVIGRPIVEIESNMDRAADIEIEMETGTWVLCR
jgi:biopolymer transport protein ExbB